MRSIIKAIWEVLVPGIDAIVVLAASSVPVVTLGVAVGF